MTNETLRMQFLSGVITEGQYKIKLQENKKKKSLNESMIGGIVGIGAINQIPPRAKADYETAFEHFLGGKYGLNEVEIEKVKIEEGAFNDLLNKMESNTRMAADILTVITLAKEDKEGNAEKAVELLMKNHDLSEEAALESVTRIFKKAFEWVDSMEEGKEVNEGFIGNFLTKVAQNTGMLSDVMTIVMLVKKNEPEATEEAVKLLMDKHDLPEKDAIEAVERIYNKFKIFIEK